MLVALALAVVALTLALVVSLVAGRGPDGGPAAAATSPGSADAAFVFAGDADSPLLLADDTEHVETRVLESGVLLVTHWIHTSAPMDDVTLDVPAGSGLAAPAVGVTHLVVAADGTRIEAPDTLDLRTGWTGSLSAAHDVYVQYQATGILRRTGSVEGRELALLTSLDVEVGRALGKSQTFPGVRVLSLACLPPGEQAMPRPCGTLDDDTWTVTSEPGAEAEMVIAQLDVAAR